MVTFDFNAEIETILNTLDVPHAFLYYDGHAETYITYMQYDKANSFHGDDELLGYVIYYDFDIYSKSNYLSLAANLIEAMTGAGWTYEVSRESPDMYEKDTKYYHKTLCFAKESEVVNNG